jgi:hypothetical protein
VQVDPAAHTVGPVHPCPPHWPYLAAVAVDVELGADEAEEEAGLVVEVDLAVELAVVVLDVAPVDEETTTPPGPATLVVKPPDSTYTPLKK